MTHLIKSTGVLIHLYHPAICLLLGKNLLTSYINGLKDNNSSSSIYRYKYIRSSTNSLPSNSIPSNSILSNDTPTTSSISNSISSK